LKTGRGKEEDGGSPKERGRGGGTGRRTVSREGKTWGEPGGTERKTKGPDKGDP